MASSHAIDCRLSRCGAPVALSRAKLLVAAVAARLVRDRAWAELWPTLLDRNPEADRRWAATLAWSVLWEGVDNTARATIRADGAHARAPPRSDGSLEVLWGHVLQDLLRKCVGAAA